MAILVKAGETTATRKRVYFQCVDAGDGMTPETGEAGGQPQISTNGAAFTNTGIGVLVAIGNGRYYAVLTDATVATAGRIIESRYKSANTAEAVGTTIQVIAFDPYVVAGAHKLTVTCQEADTTKIQGCIVKVVVTGETGGWVQQTDVNGQAIFYLSGEADPDDIGYTITVTPPAGYVPPAAVTQTIAGEDAAKTVTVAESDTVAATALDQNKAVDIGFTEDAPKVGGKVQYVQGGRKPTLIVQVKQDKKAVDVTGFTMTAVVYSVAAAGTKTPITGWNHTALTVHSAADGQYAMALDSNFDALDRGTYMVQFELYETATPASVFRQTDALESITIETRVIA